VITALAGLYVMLGAQFGSARLQEDPYSIREFGMVTEPHWGLAEEYVPVVSSKIELVPLNP